MSDVGTGTRLGRYVLGDRLAAGGMGEVYLAVQEGLGQFQKPLALKLLLPHLMRRPEAVQMFLDEARLAARMSHPNVVQIFDVGVEQGRYYIAMELVRGVSLATLIQVLKHERTPPSAALLSYIGRSLLEALHHAHDQTGADGEWLRLVHRDVTPHNVLLSVHGEVKLTDFGIAKARGQGISREGARVGKMGYLAPEQITAGPIDRRSDLFSAALTLYELATLEPAFQRSSDDATLRALQLEPLAPLAKLRPDLPAELGAALARASSKQPADRFATARAFRDAWPNLAAPETSAQLGQLIAQSCRGAIAQLDGKTQNIAAAQSHTATLTPGAAAPPATPTVPPEQPRSRPRRAGWVTLTLSLFAVGLALVLSTLAWVHQNAAPVVEPEPLREPPRPAPSVEPVVEAAAAARPAEPAPTAAPPPRSANTSARARVTHGEAAPRVGYLSVDSTPWAQVRVNGTLIGETPIARFPLAEGTARVVLVNPDSGKQATRVIAVQPGQLTSFRLILR
jgi:serine/threonine-protein kinase